MSEFDLTKSRQELIANLDKKCWSKERFVREFLVKEDDSLIAELLRGGYDLLNTLPTNKLDVVVNRTLSVCDKIKTLYFKGELYVYDFNFEKLNGIYDELFNHVKWDEHYDLPWTDIFYLIKKMKTTDKYKIKFTSPDKQKIVKLLVDKHDFNIERVEKTLQPILKGLEKKQQKKLGDFG